MSDLPPAWEPPVLDYRADLGPLGHLIPPRLCAAPALMPIPLAGVAGDDWQPPRPVVVGAVSPDVGWAWRYDCWAVTRRRDPDSGDLNIGVSVEAELALGGTDAATERIPRFWWLPAARVWLEKPVDRVAGRLVVAGSPELPPVRQLTRAADADRVIGRSGWLAHDTGWHLVVAVSELYEAEVAEEIKVAAGYAVSASLVDAYVNVVRRRTWWRWGTTGEWRDEGLFRVDADALWLE